MSRPQNSPFRNSLLMRCHRHHISDWITVALVLVLYFILEHKHPFHQLFMLDDKSLQHPFAEIERISSSACLLLAIIVPGITITAASLLSQRHEETQGFHLLHVSLLGLATTFAFNGFITNFLKLLIGRPRPDLLARCLPAPGTPMHEYVSIAVCTSTNVKVLEDGFKSAPSGHTSASFAAFLFLSLWICGQTSAFKPGNHTYKLFLAVLPLLIASYIAISRTEDYRHHPTDVMAGALLGSVIAYASYRTFFPPLSSKNCSIPYSASTLDFGKTQDNNPPTESSTEEGDYNPVTLV